MCVCKWEREREREKICVCERERERERPSDTYTTLIDDSFEKDDGVGEEERNWV